MQATVDPNAKNPPGILLTKQSGDRLEITGEGLSVWDNNVRELSIDQEGLKIWDAGTMVLWMDANGLAAYEAATRAVELDDDGLALIVGADYADPRSYQLRNTAGTLLSRLAGAYSATFNSLIMEVFDVASRGSTLYLKSDCSAGYQAQVYLEARHDTTHNAIIVLQVEDANTPYIAFYTDDTWWGHMNNDGVFLGINDEALGQSVRLQADWEITAAPSIRAAKANIEDYVTDRSKFAQLKVMQYNTVEHPNGQPEVGLIAEDVLELFPDACAYRGPRPTKEDRHPVGPLKLAGLCEMTVNSMMISVVQQQEVDIATLQTTVNDQATVIADLVKRIEALEAPK